MLVGSTVVGSLQLDVKDNTPDGQYGDISKVKKMMLYSETRRDGEQ